MLSQSNPLRDGHCRAEIRLHTVYDQPAQCDDLQRAQRLEDSLRSTVKVFHLSMSDAHPQLWRVLAFVISI